MVDIISIKGTARGSLDKQNRVSYRCLVKVVGSVGFFFKPDSWLPVGINHLSMRN
jgi:hypothetical protein